MNGCPCCKQPVNAPTLPDLADTLELSEMPLRVLNAVWQGRGLPVTSERIFDVMYADDPDGGPSNKRMYRTFAVALCRLRKRLQGSGVAIESAGRGKGYRLTVGDRSNGQNS